MTAKARSTRSSSAPYLIGVHAVTNEQFAAFVDATGHRTTAERLGSSFVFAGLLPDDFPPTRAVAAAPWWRQVQGADWRRPEGPQSVGGRRGRTTRSSTSSGTTPWRSAPGAAPGCPPRRSGSAPRGGSEGDHFPWGDEREPGGGHRMNVFQGEFPGHDTGADGWVGTCPVGSFPANGFGLHETTGQRLGVVRRLVLARDYYGTRPRHRSPADPSPGGARVMRGGCYLCHESYCWRYRVDARSANTPDSSTGNIGFRVAADA